MAMMMTDMLYGGVTTSYGGYTFMHAEPLVGMHMAESHESTRCVFGMPISL